MGMNLKNLYQNEYSFEETVNENFFKVESFTTLSVLSRINNSTDDNIINKEVYLIENNNDDLFKDKVNQLACYNANLGWIFYSPRIGNLMYLQSEKLYYYYTGSEWKVFIAGQDGTIGEGNEQQEIDTSKLLLKENNLSDIENIQTARDNLDIYSKSEVNNKFSKVENNLSDIKNIKTARDNLDIYSKSETFYKSKCLEDIPDKDKACHNIGTLRDWEIRRVGDYKFSAMKTDHDNWLICNGREISRNDYKELFSLIGTSFGKGDGSSTFNLPDFRDKTIWGANNNLNNTKEAGLPNITGSIARDGGTPLLLGYRHPCSGAIYTTDIKSKYHLAFDEYSEQTPMKISFDASLSNPIYGKSNTVQPASICVNIFILAK